MTRSKHLFFKLFIIFSPSFMRSRAPNCIGFGLSTILCVAESFEKTHGKSKNNSSHLARGNICLYLSSKYAWYYIHINFFVFANRGKRKSVANNAGIKCKSVANTAGIKFIQTPNSHRFFF